MDPSEELAKVMEEILARDEQLDDCPADLFHELRTPANAILGYVDLHAMEVFGPITAAQRQNLERIQAAVLRLLDLLNDEMLAAAGRVTRE